MAQLSAKPLVEDVGIDEHLGEMIDLDLTFVNREGDTLKLRDLIDGTLPVAIAPVYYNCPGMCTLVLSSTSDLIGKLDLDLGTEYLILNVSFDPTDTPALAKAKSESYYTTLAEPHQERARKGWYFLSGGQEQITALMDQIGFRYKKVNDQYSHSSALVMISPKGKITRYIAGVTFPPFDAKLALLEASGGKVGSPIDTFLTYCFRYNPTKGKYTSLAFTVLRTGGALSLVLLIAVVLRSAGFFAWISHRKQRRLRQDV